MPPAGPGKRHAPRPPARARDVPRGIDGVRHAGEAAAAERDEDHLDRRIAAVAARQQNLISTEQLRALGADRGAREWRVRAGRLHPQHRGVFSVGSPLLPPLGRERAALLAVRGAVLSHATAAAIWGVMPPHASGPIELTAASQRRGRPGIVVHRTNHLPAADVRTRRGFLLTSPTRTVLDLTARLSTTALERLVAEVLVLEPRALEEMRHRGSGRIRAILDGGPARTRSHPERRLLALVRDAGLPRPETNAVIAGHEVDAVWATERVVVEVDTYATHGDRIAFERDRRKDAALVALGFTPIRVTDVGLEREAARVVATIAQALVRGAAA